MFTQKQKEVIIYPLIISFICSFFFSAMVVLNFIPNGMGFSVSSGYNETITLPLTANATTISVSSVNDNDGVQLALSATNKGYFTIDPGQPDVERVICTGVSASTLTGCTRGLASSGSSETGSSTLASSHDVGSRIIMTNIAQFYNNFVNTSDAQDVAGIKNFESRPTTATSTPTSDGQVATIYDLNNATTSGGLIATESIRGTGQIATAAEQAGNSFDSSNPQFMSTKYASSTPAANFAVIAESDGKLNQGWLDLTEDYAWSGTNSNTGTTSFSGPVTFTGNVSGATKFGGSGADGALSITSGTTTIDASNANMVVKNYSSINIASSGALTISNKATDGTILVLKSVGDCTIDGVIDMSSMGANKEVNGFGILDETADHQGGHGVQTGAAPRAAGTPGVILGLKGFYVTPDATRLWRKFILVAAGSGGGDGGNGANTSGGSDGGVGGNGGVGGGAVIIECRGALDFSSTGEIKVDGGAGSNGADGSSGKGAGAGGAGGSAGMALIIYNSLTDNSGTINARGGAGGDGGDGVNSSCTSDDVGGGGGSGGSSWTSVGDSGGAGGANGANGSAGSASSDASGAGGGGGAGCGTTTGGAGGAQGSTDSNHYLVTQNYDF